MKNISKEVRETFAEYLEGAAKLLREDPSAQCTISVLSVPNRPIDRYPIRFELEFDYDCWCKRVTFT